MSILRISRISTAACALGATTLALTGTAHAQFAPGDLLAGVELLVQGGPGRIYRINAGGDFTDADFEMPDSMPVIDLCSTDDGRVLVATSTHHEVLDVTDALEAKPFATLPEDASGLFCGGGKVFATTFLEAAKLYDISAGGTITTPYAVGVNRAPVVDATGLLWVARFDGAFGNNTGRVFRDVKSGDDLTSAPGFFTRPDIFSATLHDGRVIGVAAEGDGIVDMTAGGDPQFAHAIVVAPRGIASSAGKLWVSTIDGLVFDATQSADYTNAEPFARLFGPSLSLAVVQRCGDGKLHGRETCDDGNVVDGDGCSAACLVEEPPGSTSSSTASTAAATSAVVTSTSSGPMTSTSTTTGGVDDGSDGGGGGAGDDEGDSGCAVAPTDRGSQAHWMGGIALAFAALGARARRGRRAP